MAARKALAGIGFCLVVSIFVVSLALPGGVIEAKTSTGGKVPIGYLIGNGTSALITEGRDFCLLPFFSFPDRGGVYSYSKGLTNISAAMAAISEHFKVKETYALTKYYEVLKESGIAPQKVFQRFWNPSFLIFSLGILSISLFNCEREGKGRKGLSYAIPFLSFLAGPYSPFAFLALYLLISGVQESPEKPRKEDLRKFSWEDFLFLSLAIIIFSAIVRISPLSPLPIVLSAIVFPISFIREKVGSTEAIVVSSLTIFFSLACFFHYYLLYSIPKILLATLSAIVASSGGKNKIVRGISASLIAYCSGL